MSPVIEEWAFAWWVLPAACLMAYGASVLIGYWRRNR